MEHFLNFSKAKYVRSKKVGGCVLCRIEKQDPEVEDLTVFRSRFHTCTINLYPFNPGHLLIYPQRHIEDVRQLREEEEEELWRLRNYALDMLDAVYRPQAYNIGYNLGLAAGASISHIHLHMIPRYSNEVGIPELLGGKRVLIEDPRETRDRLKSYFEERPFSIRKT
jgi:ATP adenylyltransferase